MRSRLLVSALALLALAVPAAARAEAGPAWSLQVTPMPTNFAPGGQGEVLIVANNVGAGPSLGTTKVETTLPAGLTATATDEACTIAAALVSCETATPIRPSGVYTVAIKVNVAASPAPGAVGVAISGGGGAEVTAAFDPLYQASPVPFGLLAPGLLSPLSEPDGSPTTLAGAHPYQLTTSFAFPTEASGGKLSLTGAGHLRDIHLDLPAGLTGAPAATAARCTEAQIQSRSCPDSAQVGTLRITTVAGEVGANTVLGSALYNMVPPPGAPAELATDVGGTGAIAHLIASLRSDGDYGISIDTRDILALGTQPIFGITVQTWGDPSSEAHNFARGKCQAESHGSCPPESFSRLPFLALPGSCPAAPPHTAIAADSWEAPGAFVHGGYENADLAGNPVSLSGCNALEYEPTISSRPTTDLADSPSGLEFDLRQPQQAPVAEGEDPLAGRATAELRDARVTLPAGMAVNPSQADGLGACTEAQIGYLAEGEEAGVHFSKDPQSCPEASKLGTMKVSSPLLAEYTEEGAKPVLDPETGAPIPRPLHGSVYLAEPFENPFGSLLAIYLAIEDPQSGIVAKLGGRVEPDPVSGQLTAVFEANPELPLEDIHLSLFGGARGSLITPLTCGTHTTTSDLTPWSAPEGLDAHPSDSFQTTTEPGGGACPASEGAAANKPAFQAGTLTPQAGAYSPFVLKVSREDGSQRIAGIDTLLPPGLSGKLAGIGQCSEAQIAAAKAREHPNQGILERQSPSCPASSEVGTVGVAAGAGPTPFHTSGHAYLAGPYKGAPLSLVAIVPAIAGPFDLGTVVSRVALYVDPETAQIHAVSDPLPQIIEGIPLDVRSIALAMGRPQFTLNPTSCDPMAILGTATSALGNAAALTNPFQVGGCSALAFKPKLVLKLSGATKRSGNPALRAVLTMPPGGANIAKASVALPHSEFLDQAHIRTICTRVQFAAGAGNGAACPPGSIYGKARAITPLLERPLEGPVFLRSSNNQLPDLVAALNGQIDVDLVGRVDSVKGGIRNSFEVVPDQPVSKFVLEMQGGKKGLLENSTNLCKSTKRATALFDAQNGKVADFNPVMKVKCPKKHKGKGHGKRGGHRHRTGA
jgi:hypothetical protein